MKLVLLSLLRQPADSDDVAVQRAVELAAQGRPVKFRVRFETHGGQQVPVTLEAVEATEAA